MAGGWIESERACMPLLKCQSAQGENWLGKLRIAIFVRVPVSNVSMHSPTFDSDSHGAPERLQDVSLTQAVTEVHCTHHLDSAVTLPPASVVAKQKLDGRALLQ